MKQGSRFAHIKQLFWIIKAHGVHPPGPKRCNDSSTDRASRLLNWKSRVNANTGYCLLKRHQGRFKSRATLCTHLFLGEFKGLTPRFFSGSHAVSSCMEALGKRGIRVAINISGQSFPACLIRIRIGWFIFEPWWFVFEP
jgi:hypothetical protein